MTTEIVYSQAFHKHDNVGHPENAQRLTVMMDAVRQPPLADTITIVEPNLLSEDLLYAIHSEEMIEQIKEIDSQGGAWIDLDTYVCSSDYETARLAAGGLLALCRRVLDGDTENGFALARPPGHHATPRRSMGFCLFNNIALSAYALAKKGARVLIFDPDVHDGNGTQEIFYHRKDVLYQSFHLSPHFPGTGAIEESGVGLGKGYTINAPLEYGHGDSVVSQLLDDIFLPVAKQFDPDIILVSSGFDSHHTDPLGGLRLTADMFGEMIKKYQALQPKLVCTLEGGYNFSWIGKCLLSQLGVLTHHPLSFPDTTQEKTDARLILEDVKKEVKKYWDI